MQYILDHTTLRFELTDILAIVILAVVLFIVWRKLKKMKKKQEELEKKLSEEYVDTEDW